MLWFLLLSCAQAPPSTPPVEDLVEVAPGPVRVSPPKPTGPVWVLPPGPIPESATPAAAGTPVQALCGRHLIADTLTLTPIGDGRVQPGAAACEAPYLFGNLWAHVGSGTVKVGTLGGTLTPETDVSFEIGIVDGTLGLVRQSSGWQLTLTGEDGQTHPFLHLDTPARLPPQLLWIGDMDDDFTPDVIVDAPRKDGAHRWLLTLSARSGALGPQVVGPHEVGP